MGLAGLGQFGFLGSFGLLGCGCLDGGEDQGGRALDDFKAFGQERRVAVIELDVVGGSPAGVETDGLRNDKGNCFCFGFAYGFCGCGSPLGLVKHFVRELVHQGAELLGRCLARKQSNPAAVAHPQSGCDGVLELKRYPLRGGEVNEAFPVLSSVAPGALGESGKLGLVKRSRTSAP